MHLEELGYDIIEGVYSPDEVLSILQTINDEQLDGQYGVRELLIGRNTLSNQIFTSRFKDLIHAINPSCNTLIKSIYFDKPPSANWIVNWHQDLTINVKEKHLVADYINWRVLPERVVVQPDQRLLERIFTIRIHLDDCTADNGALRVIEKSHRQGVIPIQEWKDNKPGIEQICEVPMGGALLMKPLTLHASYRTENNAHRRVIHLEFTDQELPEGLEWKESIHF